MGERITSKWESVATLVDGVHRSWSTYIVWYTPFFIANVLVWSLLASGDLAANHRSAICWVWIILDLSGICTVTVLGRYAVQVNRHVRRLLGDPGGGEADLVIPRSLSNWAAFGNVFTFVVVIAAWLYLLRAR